MLSGRFNYRTGHFVQAIEAGSYLIGEALHCFGVYRLVVIFGQSEHVACPFSGVRGDVGAELGESCFGELGHVVIPNS
ncbi:hypothetical protein D3C72_2362940 [compost metagenome]